MLCISICPKDEQELCDDFAKAKEYKECIEIRLDRLSFLPVTLLKKFLTENVTCLLTVMDKEQVDSAFSLAALMPQWLALPHDMPEKVFREIKDKWPEIKIIATYHDHEKTGDDLEAIFDFCRKLPCDMIKIVTQAHSSCDALRMLVFLKKYSDLFPLTAFCMGENGSFSRIVSSLYGSVMTFCSLEGKPTASGQLSVDELLRTYHFYQINRSTALFALIGSPISHSLSHITHNALFRRIGSNAVYVKILLTLFEFEDGFSFLKFLGIRGFSVARPLKSCFQPFSNTVLHNEKGIMTCNTDGSGMVDAIEQYGSVSGKKMIVLGAGPTAYAIAREALVRGANVVLVNRNEEKAKKLAEELACETFMWDLPTLFSFPYDVLVNATSVGMAGEEGSLPIAEADLMKKAIIADVVFPADTDTSLLQMAKKRGCQIVSGREMWLRQAAHQFHFWDERLQPSHVLTFLKEIEFSELCE